MPVLGLPRQVGVLKPTGLAAEAEVGESLLRRPQYDQRPPGNASAFDIGGRFRGTGAVGSAQCRQGLHGDGPVAGTPAFAHDGTI